MAFGIYQNCTVKNGYKKAQMPYDIWFFEVGIYFGCTIWLRRWDLKGPLENIVASGVYAVALARFSLFSPLSHSLDLALRALALQALSLPRLRRAEVVMVQIPEPKRKKEQTPDGVCSFLVAEVGFEPHDLRVMSPTSYQAALLRDILLSSHSHCLL